LERLAGIRQRTARTSRGAAGRTAANARNNTRLIATWTFHHLATFIADKAERVGSAVEWGDPADTSQTCPACCHRTKATDRRAVWVWKNAAGLNTGTRWGRSPPVAGLAGVVRAPVPPEREARTVDGPTEMALGLMPASCEALIPKAKAPEGE